MKQIFYILFLTALVLSGCRTPHAAEPSRAVRSCSLDKKYPNANAILLSDDEFIRYNPDGTSVSTDTFSYRVLTTKGRDELRTLLFRFHTNYEKISVTHLSVTKPDGRKIILDPAKLAVVSIDHSQMSARIYDPNSKQLSFTIPDLEVGDTLNITRKEETFKSRIPGQWSGFAVLQSDCPVENYTYTIDAPASRPLRSIAVKDEVKGALTFTKTQSGDRMIYRWQARNVPQLIPEPGMPPLYRCAMRVLTSTAQNWSEIASWYADLCAPRLAAVTPEMKNFVQKTIAGKKSDMEKITSLFQYVSQRIRYTGITDEETAPGYEPHDVSRTFERGHGVCRDKAALLVSLLKLAGFEAYPVLFMSGYPKDDDVPNIYFNHAIVGVKGKDGKDILMDPTFETTTDLLPAYLGNCSYLVATKKPTTLKRSPVIPAENNLLDIDNVAEISGSTLSGKVEMDFKGIHDQMYRATFSEWKPEEVRRYFAGALRDIIPGAELKKCTVTPANIRNMAEPLQVVLEYTAPDFIAESKLAPLALPEFASRFGTIRNLYNALKLEKRRFPLEALPRAVTEKFTLKLAPGISIKSIPEKVDVSIPHVLRLSREITKNGNILSGKNYFAIDTAEFTPADYLKAKAALAKFESASHSLPLIETALPPAKKSLSAADYPGADSLIISDIRTIKFHTPNSWDDVRTIKRKIFTYGGAVEHSTVNIPYHPLMEDVEISGEFITPDGKKHTLSSKEINHLDAPWAAAAKRYPAGKILTAAFPGVEPGSTVTYTITRKVKDKPYFYAEMHSRTTEPALLRKMTITPARRMVLSYTRPAEIQVSPSDDPLIATVENCPALAAEASTPPMDLVVPTFKVFYGKAGDFAKKLDATLRKKIIVTPKIRELAEKIKQNSRNDVDALHKFVTENIVEAGPALNEAPWSIFSTPEETLKSGVGNSADRAILYAALCKALKIKYSFIAVSTMPFRLNPELTFFDKSSFSSIILKIDLGGYLNASDRYDQPGNLYGYNKICCDITNRKWLESLSLYENSNDRTIECNIAVKDDSSAAIAITERHCGIYFPALNRKLSTSTPEELKQFFQSKVAAISQSATLKDFSFDAKYATIKYQFTIPGFLIKSGKYHTFELPLAKNFASMLRLSGEKRTLPYQRNINDSYSVQYSLTLPKNLKYISPAACSPNRRSFTSAELPPGSEFVKWITGYGQKITIAYMLSLPFETLQPQEFQNLFKLNKLLNDPSLRQVILEERK
ncbi:MAG: DUF3857 domain-containing protein [Lentisphaeria bacterium]|nr:DUF3857 domain-containing protein [Lentisphaeria bacterium]